MEPIKVRRLWGQVVVDVIVIAIVVSVGRCAEPRGQHQLPIQLVRMHVLFQVDFTQPPVPVICDVAPIHNISKQVA